MLSSWYGRLLILQLSQNPYRRWAPYYVTRPCSTLLGSMHSIHHYTQSNGPSQNWLETAHLLASPTTEYRSYDSSPKLDSPSAPHHINLKPTLDLDEFSHLRDVRGMSIYKLQHQRNLDLNPSYAVAFSEWFYLHKTIYTALQRKPISLYARLRTLA